jgi:quercetin dioxygenase-like cupin family protein
MRALFISSIAAALASVVVLQGSTSQAALDATPVPLSAQSLADATVSALPPSPVVVALARFTFSASASFPSLMVSGPELIYVEAGTLTVRLPGDADEAEEMGDLVTRNATAASTSAQTPATPEDGQFEFTLNPGDSLRVPSDTPHDIRNRGEAMAVFLAAAITPQPARAATPSWPPDGSVGPIPGGIELQPLDVGYATGTVSLSGSARITLSRLTIPPGNELPRHQAGGPELVTVEAGKLAIAVEGGELEVRAAPTAPVEPIHAEESSTQATTIRLAANGAALIQPGTIVTERNAGEGQLVVLRLTVLPV